MNFQKYFLERDNTVINKNESNQSSSNINTNDNSNISSTDNSNIEKTKKPVLSKFQQSEIERKNFFRENRERAKPLLSNQGLYNRRYENNFEWGHNTIINFRGVKGTDWTRDHGFTYADDFNTLERDVDSSYSRPNIKNCRFCLDSYPDTEPHHILENEPTTEIGGCIKCHPERYINNHHQTNDDYYPVKSNEINTIKPSENLSLYHNTRNCIQGNTNKKENTNDNNNTNHSKSSELTEKNEPNTNKDDKSEAILIDQNNTNVFIGDYHCRDRLKTHLNQTGFHSDNILPAGVKSVNNTVCRLKNVTCGNTSNIFFNDELNPPNLDKEKPSYKGLIRYSNQSFIPLNHEEYDPNPENNKKFDNKVYNYPNKMRINPEFDYNDTKNDYKVPFNNNSTYDEFIKNNKNAPQHMYYKDIDEQYKHLYDKKPTINNSDNNDNNNDNANNDPTNKDSENPGIFFFNDNDDSSQEIIKKPVMTYKDNITELLNDYSSEANPTDQVSNHSKSYSYNNYKNQSSEFGYYFCANDDDQNKKNNNYNGIDGCNNEEDFREYQLRISEENGYLNGYLPNKYQSYEESYDNPLYFDKNIKSRDKNYERRMNKIENRALEESVDNSLARQYDSEYETKAQRKRELLYQKMNHIRYNIDNWENFVALNTFDSKLKENLVPSKKTENQKVNVDNIYFGVYPVQHKRPGNEPPFDKEKLDKETPLRFLADFGVEFDKGTMKCREPPFDDCNCWINETSKAKVEQPLPYLYASRNIKFNELKANSDYISPNLKRLLDQDYRNTGKIGPNSKETPLQSEKSINSIEINNNISSSPLSPTQPSHSDIATTTSTNNTDNENVTSNNNNSSSSSSNSKGNGSNGSNKNSNRNSAISSPKISHSNSINHNEKSITSTASSKNKIQFHNNSYIDKDDLSDLIINQKDSNSSNTTSQKSVKAPKRITCRDRSHNYVIYDYESIKAKARNNNRIKNLASKQKIYKSSLDVLG